jgi:RNA recognition motif-containing protein
VKSEELVDDSESDTESVCSTLSASSSVASSSDKAKVRVTFPPFITTKQLYRHFCSYGYDETEIHIQRHINRRTGKPCGSATVIVSSQPGMFISHLNDSLIFKLHKLKAEPYMEGRRQERRQKRSSKQPKVSTTSPDTFHSTRSSSDPYRVFVDSGLPTFINEQHIREHFQQLAHEIVRIDTIKDKITQMPKGYFFITFKSQASADMAIQMFHKSFLSVGDYSLRIKVERQRSAQPQFSGLVEAPCSPNTDSYSAVQATSLVVDNLSPAITDDEIKALISVPTVAVINDEGNPQRRYIQFYSHNDAITAQDRLNGKSFLGLTILAAINNEVQTPSPNVVSQYQHRQDLQQPEQQYPYYTVPQTYQYDPQQHGHTFSPEQFQQTK